MGAVVFGYVVAFEQLTEVLKSKSFNRHVPAGLQFF